MKKLVGNVLFILPLIAVVNYLTSSIVIAFFAGLSMTIGLTMVLDDD